MQHHETQALVRANRAVLNEAKAAQRAEREAWVRGADLRSAHAHKSLFPSIPRQYGHALRV